MNTRSEPRYAVSISNDYSPNPVVIRDFNSTPLAGRVLAVITRDDRSEAELIAQNICDLLNEQEKNMGL